MKLKVAGGELKGKPLASLKGRGVRPTSGLVREAMFDILFSRVRNAVVLDLFAGTGALGIESLSRGAARAVFVDNSPSALTVIKQNIQNCGLESVAVTLRQDATRKLSGLTAFDAVFDIVFMDPPYDQGAVSSALAALAATSVLKPGAVVAAEHSRREAINDTTGRFKLLDQRKYGDTLVSFLDYVVN